MRIPLTSINVSTSSVLRVLNWLAVMAYAIGTLVHKRFPEVIAWLSPEVKTAVVLAVFALLADRILRVHNVVCEPPLKLYKSRETAYEDLAVLVQKHRVKRVDLIQFSGQTAVQLIRSIAANDRLVQVRLFLAHPDQAALFDRDVARPGEFHINRINDTLLKASMTHQEHPTCKIEAFYYSSPAGPSVVIIDGWISSLGWYHCFCDSEKGGAMRIRGHAAPAITATGSRNDLTRFAEEQIENLSKTAIVAELPSVPAIGDP